MASRLPAAPNSRALRILFNTYWTPSGWRSKPESPSADDFALAKGTGVMFDPVDFSHEDTVKRARNAVAAIERQAVANAFVVSLPTRRLELRSALGSFAVLQHFPEHVSTDSDRCKVCGVWDKSGAHDLNVLNFERFKWGGVRHSNPVYASLDLDLFSTLPRISPEAADVATLKSLLKAIDDAPEQTTATALERHFGKTLRSSKNERQILIGILGLCGILAPKEHPGFFHRFVHYSKRALPPRHFIDMAYPACWWRRSNGVNQEAVMYWFGHIL